MREENQSNKKQFHFKSREVLGRPKKPEVAVWLEEKGIVKNERAAQFILIGVIVFCFGLAGILFMMEFGDSSNNIGSSIEQSEIFKEVIKEKQYAR